MMLLPRPLLARGSQWSLSRLLIPIQTYSLAQVSRLHTHIIPRPDKPRIPPPKPDIPDVKTFLARIGRDALKECEDKILSWRQLFRADGQFLKKKEIPARLRRYILLQTERYRLGMDIKYIPRGKKVKGGERRRNKGVTKSKIQR